MSRKITWKALKESYAQFAEGHGFAVIMTVCIAVITGTAVWTRSSEPVRVSPTPPNVRDVSAAQLMQESLANVRTPGPAPTQTPAPWQRPVESIQVLRRFDARRMVQSGVTGVWAIHDAADIAVEKGEIVRAMSDGTVAACGDGGIEGAFVTISHPEDVTVHYAGMEMLGAIRTGDRVRAGQTIGFGGNTYLSETDLGPHLHLRIVQNGSAIDPMVILDKTGAD